ncbi:biotin carboxylase N-terminal domain-containing protein [Shimia sp.]|uniref:ATP-binding protein n=1 Tax=Shimia sp. TaxID=1954381 RepID=UPI003567A23A
MGFDTILVANRGEIALRIIATLRQQGYRSVAVYSEADRDAPHVAAADRAVCLGPADSARSYLDGAAIIAAARRTGAGAVHPGYGFLSENADFAASCAEAGLVFIGPDPQAIRIMGDKARARAAMEAAGVACLPGDAGADQRPEALARAAGGIGYPVMLKAAAGGGGKGMRLVQRAEDFAPALALARSEAEAAFGSGHMLIERALVAPRHVEVQILADRHGTVLYLGERDCSVQRRHQKVLEEAPAPGLSAELRARMGAMAVQAAGAVDYVGAGTVEFLLTSSGEFFFLEMNTRLQVEHPVTEMVTGIDLVDWQIRIAQGEALAMAQADLAPRGWAIEARLYAEDPAGGFLPSSGPVLRLELPQGAGLRCDMGVAEGGEVTPHYDPMLGKIIAHGASRDEARRRLLAALRALVLFGPVTNQGFLIRALEHPAFAAGAVATDFIPRHLAPPEARAAPEPENVALAAALLFTAVAEAEEPRLSRPAHYLFDGPGGPMPVVVRRRESGLCVDCGGQSHRFAALRHDGRHWQGEAGGERLAGAALLRGGTEIWLARDGQILHLADRAGGAGAMTGGGDAGALRAPMHGRVVALALAEGAPVRRDQPLLVLEAMKMQHSLRAAAEGVLARLLVAEGDQVAAGQLLAEITTEPATDPATESSTESSTETGTESSTETGTESSAETGTESSTETGTEPATETGTEARTGELP